MVAHTCNPSTLGGRGRRISEFEANLVSRVSSRRARATQRNPVSEKQTNKQTNKQKEWEVKFCPKEMVLVLRRQRQADF